MLPEISHPQYVARWKHKVTTNEPSLTLIARLIWPGWHLRGLSRLLGVPYQTARGWLTGRSKMPIDKAEMLRAYGLQKLTELKIALDGLDINETNVTGKKAYKKINNVNLNNRDKITSVTL